MDRPTAATPQYRVELFTLPDGRWFAVISVTLPRSAAVPVSTSAYDTCRQALDAAAKWVAQHRTGRTGTGPVLGPTGGTGVPPREPQAQDELPREHC